MVFPPLPSVSFGEDGDNVSRKLTTRIKKYCEEDKNPRGFNVFISALKGEAFKPVSLTLALHSDYPSPQHAIKIFYLSKTKIRVNCDSPKTANDIATNVKYLVSYQIQINFQNVEIKGRVPIDPNYSEEYIYNSVEIYNENTLYKKPKILEVFRIQKKTSENGMVHYTNTNNVILTFQGQVLPRKIILDQLIIPVFVQTENIRQCKKCWRFGHSVKGCRSNIEICNNCGDTMHENADSPCLMKCINCGLNDHSANSKTCPIYMHRRDKNIEIAKSTRRDDSVCEEKTFIYTDLDFPELGSNTKKNTSS